MKYYAIFKSDGSLLSYAHEGYEDLTLPNYQGYSGLQVVEIPEITNDILKLVDGEIIKEVRKKSK